MESTPSQGERGSIENQEEETETKVIKTRRNSILGKMERMAESMNKRNSLEDNNYNVKSEIYQKINSLANTFQFTQSYSNDVVTIMQKLVEITFKKTNNTINQNKIFLKFFKEVTNTYQKFSTDLVKANTILKSSIVPDQIFNEAINIIFEKTQETIASNFLNFSNIIHSTIISDGPFSKIKDFYKRMNTIQKAIEKDLNKLVKRKEKINKLYTNKYSKLFEEYKNCYQEPEKLDKICDKYDFFNIELELVCAYDKLFESSQNFHQNFQKNIANLKTLLSDYIEIVKHTIEIYIKENQKLFAGQMNLNFETIQKFYDGINKESIENSFSLKNLLKESDVLKMFNDMLKTYQTNLIKYNIVKDEDIYNAEKFKVEAFSRFDDFVDSFIQFNPKKMEHSYTLVDHIFKLKRDPGFFKNWKSAILVFTKQQNAIVFDDKLSSKFANMINLKRAKLRVRSETKNPFRFEISEIKKGILFNSNNSFLLDAEDNEKFDLIIKIMSQSGLSPLEDTIISKRGENDILDNPPFKKSNSLEIGQTEKIKPDEDKIGSYTER
jgi:hypothetical protein